MSNILSLLVVKNVKTIENIKQLIDENDINVTVLEKSDSFRVLNRVE